MPHPQAATKRDRGRNRQVTVRLTADQYQELTRDAASELRSISYVAHRRYISGRDHEKQ